MIKSIITVFLLFSANLIYSEMTYTYLIDMRLVSKPDQFNQMLDKGLKNDGQPFKNTSILYPENTNYALLNLTFKDDTESGWFVNQIENHGIGYKHQKQYLNSKYDARIGGNVIELINEPITPLPTDFYSVKVSS